MTPEQIARLSAAVPRYTSYPTANHFSDRVQGALAAAWLTSIPADSDLSLYLHFPFCRAMCWYCACNTKAVRQYAPISHYLDALDAEMAHVAGLLPAHRVTHIHWGGGSPDALKAEDIRRTGLRLKELFQVAPEAEIAVEIDPRVLEPEQITAFTDIGVNRISLGVQDFAEAVQAAIGREQSFAVTRAAIEGFRRRGVPSVNVDLVYGLPHQTLATVTSTIERVIELAPDRIAVFGYAHLPQRMRHQRLIDEAALPGPVARLELSQRIAHLLVTAGYLPVGLDHFAKPGDRLARAALTRNFQGYTTDHADALIGLGASSISRFPQGFTQNATGIHDYERRIAQGELATARGIALTRDDRIRSFVIERLMCDFAFDAGEVRARFGAAAEPVVHLADDIRRDAVDLVEPTDGGFRMRDEERALVRTVCARFDSYLGTSAARHSQAV